MWRTWSTILDSQLRMKVRLRTSSSFIIGPAKHVVSALKKKRDYGGMAIMTAAKDWMVVVDLDKQLRFPQEFQVQTQLRPDLIMYSNSIKRII